MVIDTSHGPDFLKRFDDFFYKERISFCLVCDERFKCIGKLGRIEQCLSHCRAVPRGEILHHHLGLVCTLSKRMHIARTIGQQT